MSAWSSSALGHCPRAMQGARRKRVRATTTTLLSPKTSKAAATLVAPASPVAGRHATGVSSMPPASGRVGVLVLDQHRTRVLALGRDVAVDEFDDRDRRGVGGAE